MNIEDDVKKCNLCAEHLPLGPRPVFQIHPHAKILIAGQAPGLRVHKSGIPFDDPSGDRLRSWMGLNKEQFYNPELVAFLPMGFCYPGTGSSGDYPPRPECAAQWRQTLLSLMPALELKLIIGQYAQKWHLKEQRKKNLTETVRAWEEFWPSQIPLPHPSPRNNIWLKKNPWFEHDLIPALQKQIRHITHK